MTIAGVNISLSLDEMIEQLKLDGSDGAKFRLFRTNDNAAYEKLGINLSDYLQEYPYKIHTLELVLKDGVKGNGYLIPL